jgi:glycosyltransferase involved in cell wall biosynthesis
LPRYVATGASSRVRIAQYLPSLRDRGFDIEWQPLLGDRYLERLYTGRRIDPFDVLKSYGRRLARLLGARRFDTVWIEKETLPWLPAWCERIAGDGTRWVVDFDDAIHVRYATIAGGLLRGKIPALMRRAGAVVAGNRWLADYARAQGARRVVEIPSLVDVRSCPSSPPVYGGAARIGWIGSPATEPYLALLSECIESLSRSHGVTLLTVGARRFAPDGVPVERRPWQPATEQRDLLDMDIGIMPLTDTDWERGKCGYKLIQYMAHGRPVVASAVGANLDIVTHGHDGFLAGTIQQWREYLGRLAADPALRARMGSAARRTVEQRFALHGWIDQMAAVLRPDARV